MKSKSVTGKSSNVKNSAAKKLLSKNALQQDELLNGKTPALDEIAASQNQYAPDMIKTVEEEFTQVSPSNAGEPILLAESEFAEPEAVVPDTSAPATATQTPATAPAAQEATHATGAAIPSNLPAGTTIIIQQAPAAAVVESGVSWGWILGGAAAIGGVAAAAGGGGKKSSTTTPTTPTGPITYALAGAVADGKIVGAKIYVDLDDDGIADTNEYTGLVTLGTLGNPNDTNNGKFSGSTTLNTSGHALIAVGGTNVDTGLLNSLVLKAPAGSAIINPLTTLLQNTIKNTGMSVAAAEAQLKGNLGLTLPTGEALTHYDPLATPVDPIAIAVQKIAAQVVAVAMATVKADAAVTDNATAATAYAKALDSIAKASAILPIDLGNSADVTTILSINGVSALTKAALATAITTDTGAIALATDIAGISLVQKAAGLPPALTVSLKTDTGTSATDLNTKDGTLNITGKQTGLTVEYSTNGGMNWASTFTAVEGQNIVQVRQKDFAGNVSPSATLTFTLDTIAPIVTGINVGIDTTIDASEAVAATPLTILPTLATGETFSTVTVQGFSKTGTFISKSATLSNGVYVFDATQFADGALTVQTLIKDLAGNQRLDNNYLTLDRTVAGTGLTAPTVALTTDTGSSTTDKITNVGTLNVSAPTTGASIEYSTNGGSTWSTSFTAVSGSNTVQVRQNDGVGTSPVTTLTFTLDSVAPTTAPTVALTSDTGTAGDKITSNGTLNVTGIEAGATVEYSANGTSGWSTIAPALAQDSNTVYVRQVDAAGNASPTSTLTFTYDNVASAPTVGLTDTGSSNTDKITSNGILNVSGTENGATVEYSTNGGTTWTSSFSAVQGSNSVQVRQKDVAGNTSTSSTLTFTLDTTANAPTVALTTDSGSSATDKVTKVGKLTLSGTETGATPEYSIDNGVTWTTSFVATEGVNTVQVRQKDVAGNTSGATSLTFTYDTVVPTAATAGTVGGNANIGSNEATTATAIVIPVATGETVSQVKVAGTANAVNGGGALEVSAVKNQTSGNWEFDATKFVDGILKVTATTNDLAGNNPQTGTFDLTLSATVAELIAPTVVLTTDTGSSTTDKITSNGALTVTGTTVPVEYSIDGKLSTDPTKTWSGSFTAAPGLNNVDVRQNDGVGNTSPVTTLTFTLDNTAPLAAPTLSLSTDTGSGIGAATDKITSNGVLSVTSVDAGATVEYSANGTSGWSTTAPTLAQGSNTVYARQVDAAGNASAASAAFTFTYDNVAPTASPTVALTTDSGTATNDKITNVGTLNVTGTEVGATAEYSTDGGLNWVASFNAVQGSNTVQVRQKDVAGNTSAPTTFTFTYDNVASAPTLALQSDSGSSATDKITNNGVLSVSGSETGATIEYSATGIAGSWSATAPALVQGSNTVYVRQTDAAGNISNASTPFTFTYDNVAAAPTVALTTDSGVAADKISNVGTLNVTATETGATVEYSTDNGVTWTSSFTAAEGANTVQVRQKDTAGNISTATTFSFTLDTVASAPTVSLTTDSGALDKITNWSALTVTVPVSAGAVIEYTTTDPAGTGVVWSTSQPTFATDGAKTVWVRQTDPTGNLSPITKFDFTLDTVVPATPTVALVSDTGSSAADKITSNGALSVTGTELLATVEYSVDGGITWASTYSPVEGSNTVQVRQLDVAGNASKAASITFTLDTQISPTTNVTAGGDKTLNASEATSTAVITVIPPNPNQTINSVLVWGFDKLGNWTSKTALAGAGGDFTFDATNFADGDLTVRVTASDVAGNTVTSGWGTNVILKSTTAAGVTTVDAGGDLFINAAEGTATALLNVVPATGESVTAVTVSGWDTTYTLWTTVAATVNAANGTASFDATQFADGQLTVDVTTTTGSKTASITLDTATPTGPWNVYTNNWDFQIDATEASATTVLNLSISDWSANVTAVTVSGTVKGGTTAHNVNAVYDPMFGNWTFDATGFADGALTVQTVTADAAGNFVNNSYSLTLNTVTVNAGGDAYINQWENYASTYLSIFAPVNDTVNSVTITGTPAITGGATSTTAVWSYGNQYTFDSTLFADGALTVTVNTTPLGGGAGDLAPVTITKDTTYLGPVSVSVGTDTFITATEASTATKLTLSPLAADETIQAVNLNGYDANWNWINVFATKDAFGDWVFDATPFRDGGISVQIFYTDVAGNYSYNYFSLNKDSTPVDAGGDYYINKAEATTTATLNLLTATGDSVTGVSVSGWDATYQNWITLDSTATVPGVVLNANGTASFDATLFADGSLTVDVTTTQNGLKTAYITLDTAAPLGGPWNVYVGWDYNIDASEASTATVLQLSGMQDWSANVTAVTVTGTPKVGKPATVNAVYDPMFGNWTFDATGFADGALSVQTVTADTAGNSVNNSYSLTLNTAAATAGGDNYINANETWQWVNDPTLGWIQQSITNLNVFAPMNDTVNSVTITGTPAIAGGATSTTAILSFGQYTFDSTLFADGALTVTVNTTPLNGVAGDLAPVTINKDTFATGPVSVSVGADTNITATEASIATKLTIPALAADETIQNVTLNGYDANWNWINVLATKDANGDWVFDATPFRDGNISVQTYTTDVAGNYSYNYFNLNKDSTPVNAGGDYYINKAEATTTATLTLLTAAGDSVTNVKVSGWDKTYTSLITLDSAGVPAGVVVNAGTAKFDASLFADGSLTVDVTTAQNGLKTAYITLDTAVPLGGPWNVYVGWDYNIDASEVSTATVLQLSGMQDWSASVTAVTVNGTVKGGTAAHSVNAVYDPMYGNWTFDATVFKDGPLTVQTVTADAAGNSVSNNYSLTLNTAAANAGGDAYISQWENSTLASLSIFAPMNDTVNSVTIYAADANGAAIPGTGVIASGAGSSWSFDSTLFAEGNLSVVVNTTPLNGVAGDLAPVTITKDTLAPAAQLSIHVGGDANITLDEIGTATQITVGGQAQGERIQDLYIYGQTLMGWTGFYATKDAQGNFTFDATQFVDGQITVQASVYDAAGNNAWSTWGADLLNLSTSPVNAGVDAYINKTEATTTATLNLLTGDSVTGVNVSGWDTTNTTWTTVAATVTGNTASFDATLFADGSLTVEVTTANGLKTAYITLDTVAPTAPWGVYVGDTNIDASEVSTATMLYVSKSDWSATITSVTVSGIDKTTNLTRLDNATQNQWGDWVFDSTVFKDGPLTVQTVTSDTAGNSVSSGFTLNLNTAPVNVGGDAYLNSYEQTYWINDPNMGWSLINSTALTVFAPTGETVNSVTITGAPAGTGTGTVQAALDLNGKWAFDATQFAEGALTITVNATPSATGVAHDLAPVTIIKDTTAPVLTNVTVQVGGDAVVSGAENTTTAPLTFNGLSAGDSVTYAEVSGNDTNSMWTWATAAKDGNGNWTFDATKFAAGSLNVYANVSDAAGNYSSNYLSLTKVASGGATVTTLDNNTTVNSAEAGLATVLNVNPNNASDTIQSVLVKGFSQQTGAPMSVAAVPNGLGQWTFDSTGFSNWNQLSVDVTINGTVSTSTLNMNAQSFWTDTPYHDGMLAGAHGVVTVHSAQLPVGQAISQVMVSGLDTLGNPVAVFAQAGGTAGTWTFDTTVFADNISLTLNGTVIDVATGNQINGTGSALHLVSASTAIDPFPATLVIAGNNSFINQWGQFNTTLQVFGGTPASTVTVSDGVNTQSLNVTNGMANGFNPGMFNEGVLTVTTDTGVTRHLYKDTVAPPGVFNVTSGGDYVVGPTDIVGTMATIAVVPTLAVGEQMQSLSIMGADATGTVVSVQAVQDVSGNWTFDTAQFVQGSRLVVSLSVMDAAGNSGGNNGPFNQLILNKTGGFVVPQINVGGDIGINNYELTTFNPGNPANSIPGTTIDLSQVAGGVSSVSISGLSAATGGYITIDSASASVQLGAGEALFDATQFSSDQYLSVSVNGGAVTGSLGLDTRAPENWAAPTQVAAGGSALFDANLMFWDPIAVGNVPLATLVVNQSANLAASMAGSMVTVAPTVGATGYGWLTLAGMDQAGNFNTVDVQVAIFNPLNQFDTSITPNQITDVTGSADARFRDVMGTSNDVFLVGANSNVLIQAGAGNDVVVLSDAALNHFSAIRGGSMDVAATAAATDMVQLTSTFSSLDLGQFNSFGQQALYNFEKINMATDAGANTVTLGASDLFLMYSETVDASTGAMVLAIDGGTNDVVNCGLNTVAGFTQVAGSFDVAGNAGVGYGKYSGSYTDFGNNTYLVELLIQNGVQVI